MNILFIVSTPGAGRVLLPMAAACRRKGITWGFFFTNDGVQALTDPNVVEATRSAQQTVVCEYSWDRFMGHQDCPAELGSQTQNSMMVGEASHIVSL